METNSYADPNTDTMDVDKYLNLDNENKYMIGSDNRFRQHNQYDDTFQQHNQPNYRELGYRGRTTIFKSNLSKSNLKQCMVTNIKFIIDHVTSTESVDFAKSQLCGCKFIKNSAASGNIYKFFIDDIRPNLLYLANIICSHTVFDKCEFIESVFYKSYFMYTVFSYATFDKCLFIDCMMNNVKFSRCKFIIGDFANKEINFDILATVLCPQYEIYLLFNFFLEKKPINIVFEYCVFEIVGLKNKGLDPCYIQQYFHPSSVLIQFV